MNTNQVSLTNAICSVNGVNPQIQTALMIVNPVNTVNVVKGVNTVNVVNSVKGGRPCLIGE